MAKKVDSTIINNAIDYFLNNNVRFIDVANIFGISTSTLSQHLKKKNIKVDSQRTRRGKDSWNKGKTKESDCRVAAGAKNLSSKKVKSGLRSGYATVYCLELKKRVKLHDYVWYQNTGYWPNGKNNEQIHHIDGDKANNSFDNLLLTNAEEHSKIHKQYEEVFYRLLKENLVKFDKEKRGIDWQNLEESIKKLKA